MSAYKYPYIADKEMYAAVMGACSWIREKGYFNKAVDYYAKKYGVDKTELAKHIRERQSVGQKGKTAHNKGKKYKWFIVARTCWTDASGETEYSDFEILKGLSGKSVVRRYSEADWKYTVRMDYGGSYAPVIGHKAIAEFETEEEAEKALKMMMQEG